ncbi:MAG: hypothetical protein CMC82_01000 [Flavobacteriaceae bacterium]|nr:hypothetical protein [Flavobacteriaceae bacterium]|tara:strand:- start:2985 stop:3683 length:699 start_codon:yes stop_codon:yes gene_type:complete
MKILAIIPARQNSKGIKNKNMTSLCGYPLIYWTIKAAQDSELIDKIIVSTDSSNIKKYSEKFNIQKTTFRPKKFSTDSASTHSVIKYELSQLKKKGYKPDIILTLQPTSPLRNSSHIQEALKLIIEDENADAVVSCVEIPHNFSPESTMQIKNKKLVESKFSLPIYNRKKKVKYFARNGAAIYATRSRIIEKKLFNENTIPFEMSLINSVDIDNTEDLKIAELFLLDFLKKK